MKITDQKPNIELSSDMKSKMFGIGDAGMIFDILRNKLYSNPIAAICREICCNARDAHREVGKHDLPIEVTLPTALESYFKVKDFGPGISPDRIENIFINYGASTKRTDNIQTGGFGIGAKVPFSYTDTFTITTIVDGTEYNYACVIDETKTGKLMLLGSQPTTSPNGTEIKVPVKSHDRRIFSSEFYSATEYWDVKPQVFASDTEYRNIVKTFEGNSWFFEKEYRNGDIIKINIDGVIYPVSARSVLLNANEEKDYYHYSHSNEDYNFVTNLSNQLVISFNIGELGISANRETLYLDEKTKSKVKNSIVAVKNEIVDNIEKVINLLPNLWEAEVKFTQDIAPTFYRSKFLKNVKWNNIKLTPTNEQFPVQIINFTRDRKHQIKAGDAIDRHASHSIEFVNNTMLLYYDYADHTQLKASNVRHLFTADSKLERIQIICPTDKINEEDLKKSTNYEHWGVKKFSDVAQEPKEGKKYNGIKFILYKFDISECKFQQVSQASCEADKQEKVFCTLEKAYGSGVTGVIINNKKLTLSDFFHLQKINHKISFYGAESTVPKDKTDKIKIDQSLDAFIDNKLKPSLDKNQIVRLTLLRQAHGIDYSIRHLSEDIKSVKAIAKSDSLAHKTCAMYETFINSGDIFSESKIKAYRIFVGPITDADLSSYMKQHPELNASDITQQFWIKYPLLKLVLNHYSLRHNMKDVISYINLIDAS